MNFGSIEIIDRAGTVTLNSDPSAPMKRNQAAAAYFRAHQDADDVGLYISDPYKSAFDGRWRIALTRRLSEPDGSFAGVVKGTIDIALFQTLFEAMNVGADGVLSLYLDDGALLARAPSPPTDLGTAPRVSTIRAATQFGYFVKISPVDGVKRLYDYRRISSFPLIVNVGVATQAIDGPWLDKALVMGLVLAVLCAASIILAVTLRREFRRRGAAERATAEAGAQYRLLADNVTDIISKTDPDGIRRYVSPAYTRLLGFTAEEINGTRSADFAHPDDAPRVAAALEICAAGNTHASCIYRTRRRDGRWIWVEARHQSVHNDAGDLVEIVSTIRDITAQKEAYRRAGREDRDAGRHPGEHAGRGLSVR